MKHLSTLKTVKSLAVITLSLSLAHLSLYAQDASQKSKLDTGGATNAAKSPEKPRDKGPFLVSDKAGKADSGLATGSGARGKILWAARSIASSSGAGASSVLGVPGSPVTRSIALGAEGFVWVADFSNIEIYGDLAGLLAGSIAGDQPTPEQVRNAQIIAWEGNGLSTTEGGGWESSIWFFTDRGHSYAETFAETTRRGTFAETGTNRATFLSGTVRCREYWRFFHGAAPSGSDCQTADGSDFMSWILITLPSDINVFSRYFTIWVSGTNHTPYRDPLLPELAEGIPDPTGIGILEYR